MGEVYYFEYWLDRGSSRSGSDRARPDAHPEHGPQRRQHFYLSRVNEGPAPPGLSASLRCAQAARQPVSSSRDALNFDWKKMKELIDFYHMPDNDTIFAYDLAWEPNFGNQAEQQKTSAKNGRSGCIKNTDRLMRRRSFGECR